MNQYKYIFIEDIALQKLSAKASIKAVRRTYSDVAWGQFTQYMMCKAESAGTKIHKVDPAYTTQTCSKCGLIASKELTKRVHSCSCGHIAGRDVNAAQNILRRGLASLGIIPLETL